MALGGPESIMWRAQVAPETLSGTEKSIMFRALYDISKDLTDPKAIRATQDAALWFGRESILDLFRAVHRNPRLVKLIHERIEDNLTKFNEGYQEMAGLLTLGEVGLTKTPQEQVQQIYDGQNKFSNEQRRMVALAWGKRLLREGLDETTSVEVINFIVHHPRGTKKSPDTKAALELAGAAFEGIANPTKPIQQRLLFPR